MSDYTSTDLELQEERIAQRKEYLKQLARQAMQQQQINMPQGQMVGRFYVPPSWTEQLSAASGPAINSIAQGYEQSQLDKDRAEYQKQDEQARKAWLASKPQVKNIDLSGPTESSEPLTGQVAPTQQDNLNWIDQGRGIPSLRGTVAKAFEDQLINEPEREEAREFRKGESKLARDARLAEAEATRQARKDEQDASRTERTERAKQEERLRRDLEASRSSDRAEDRSLRKAIADQINALGQNKVEAAKTKLSKLSERERRELDDLGATEQGLSTAITALKSAPDDISVGWVGGLVQNKVPGGETIVSKVRPKAFNDARQDLSFFADAIRHDRYGATLTMGERSQAAQYLPTEYDSKEALIRKAEGLQRLISLNNQRLRTKDKTTEATSSPATSKVRTYDPATGDFK